MIVGIVFIILLLILILVYQILTPVYDAKFYLEENNNELHKIKSQLELLRDDIGELDKDKKKKMMYKLYSGFRL